MNGSVGNDGNRRMYFLILAVMTVAILIAVWIGSNPLRRSDVNVRAWLLSKTPLGISRSDARTILEQRGWQDERFHQTRPPPAAEPFLGGEIGSYQGFPWHTSVRAFWEFDTNDRLTNIRIQRIMDST